MNVCAMPMFYSSAQCSVRSGQWAGPGLGAGRGQPPVTVTKRTSAASDGMASSLTAVYSSAVIQSSRSSLRIL